MSGNQYNLLVSCFFIAYIIFDFPAMWMCKKLGPRIFLSCATLAFGLCTFLQSFARAFWQAAILRTLLGASEAGMLPGIAYYLSRWFQQAELTFYLSLYIVTAPLAGAFGGLLASGLLKIPASGFIRSWRWIFLVEGLITILAAFLSYFLIPEDPYSALPETDAEILCKAISDERGGTREPNARPSSRLLKLSILSPVTIATSVIFLFNSMTVQGFGVFAPSIVKAIFPRNTVTEQQLLTVPPYVFAATVLLLTTGLSMRFNQRCIFMVGSAIPVAIGFSLLVSPVSASLKYAAMFFAAGAFAFGALCNSQASANTRTDQARNFALAFVTTSGNIGGFVSSWIYLPSDAPAYLKGHGINLAGTIVIIAVGWALLYWMKRDNKQRDEKVDLESFASQCSSTNDSDEEWTANAFRWRP